MWIILTVDERKLRPTLIKETVDDKRWLICTDHFDDDLRLEEVDVLGEVESVLATVSDHVRIEDVVGALERARQMCLIDGALKWTLKQAHQQIDHLEQLYLHLQMDRR